MRNDAVWWSDKPRDRCHSADYHTSLNRQCGKMQTSSAKTQWLPYRQDGTRTPVCLKSEIHEIHEIQSLSRNPLSNQRNPLPKERNPLTYYEIHLYIAKTNQRNPRHLVTVTKPHSSDGPSLMVITIYMLFWLYFFTNRMNDATTNEIKLSKADF